MPALQEPSKEPPELGAEQRWQLQRMLVAQRIDDDAAVSLIEQMLPVLRQEADERGLPGPLAEDWIFGRLRAIAIEMAQGRTIRTASPKPAPAATAVPHVAEGSLSSETDEPTTASDGEHLPRQRPLPAAPPSRGRRAPVALLCLTGLAGLLAAALWWLLPELENWPPDTTTSTVAEAAITTGMGAEPVTIAPLPIIGPIEAALTSERLPERLEAPESELALSFALDPSATSSPAPPPSLRVFVHYSRGAVGMPGRAESVAELIRKAGFEAVSVYEVPFAIEQGRLRYFHDVDRSPAQSVATALGGEAEWQIEDLTHYRPQPRRGTLEVWVAPEADP